jgi:hypothetical protein
MADYTLPAERTIDWSTAGVWYNSVDPTKPWDGTKGIPTYPVGITMQSTNPSGAYYINPTAGVDNRAAIQAAIDACPLGNAVLLPAGTFTFGSTVPAWIPLYIRNRRVLRGSGPGITTITSMTTTGTQRSIIFASSGMGNIGLATVGPDPGNTGGPLSSGYTKGSYTVVVTDAAVAATLSVGCTVLINQTNDPEFVDNVGYGGTCTWAPGGGARAFGEVKMISAITGTSITFSQPMYYTYEAAFAPKITRLNTPAGICMNAGIEDLTYDGDTDGGYGGAYAICFQYCAHCWAKGLEIKDWNSQFFRFEYTPFGCEIRKCYFHDCTAFTGGAGYGMGFLYSSTGNLIEDNIFKWVHVCTAMGGGGATANVIGYNYCHSTNHWQYTWCMSAWGSHGAHTYMNLEEGNEGTRHLADGYWGSGSHLVMFRNWSSLILNNDAQTNNRVAMEIEGNRPAEDPAHRVANRTVSVVANILGHSGMTPAYYQIGTDGAVDHHTSEHFIWKIGYPGASQDAALVDPEVESTLIRHGNYDYCTNSVADYVGGESTDFADSLYLSSKPSWFGTLDWPPFGPDITGYTKTTAAKWRWDQYQATADFNYLFTDDIGETTGYVQSFDASIIVSESETARLYVEYPHKRVVAGTSATYVIHVEPYNSFTANVTLDATGLPTNATDAYSTNPIAYTGSATATITTTGVAAGTYSIYFTGTAVGGEVGSVRVILEVVAAEDCAPKVPIRKIRVKQGDNAVFTIEANPTAGYAGDMDLSASGVPTGATGTFADTTIAYNESTTFTVDSGTASVGEHEITITGEGPA